MEYGYRYPYLHKNTYEYRIFGYLDIRIQQRVCEAADDGQQQAEQEAAVAHAYRHSAVGGHKEATTCTVHTTRLSHERSLDQFCPCRSCFSQVD
jgi:hypothetical protein